MHLFCYNGLRGLRKECLGIFRELRVLVFLHHWRESCREAEFLWKGLGRASMHQGWIPITTQSWHQEWGDSQWSSLLLSRVMYMDHVELHAIFPLFLVVKILGLWLYCAGSGCTIGPCGATVLGTSASDVCSPRDLWDDPIWRDTGTPFHRLIIIFPETFLIQQFFSGYTIVYSQFSLSASREREENS